VNFLHLKNNKKSYHSLEGRFDFNLVTYKYMNGLSWTALVILIIGGLNWGLVGLFGYDVVSSVFGSIPALARIIYVVVGLSAIYVIFARPEGGRVM
jgi:hypothetical protein